MVAEIGGYVGLLLGISLFKLGSYNNYLIDYYVSKKYRKRSGEVTPVTPISISGDINGKKMGRGGGAWAVDSNRYSHM